jgi:hypothetical protein
MGYFILPEKKSYKTNWQQVGQKLFIGPEQPILLRFWENQGRAC